MQVPPKKPKERRCTRCLYLQPLSEFSREALGPDGLRRWCRTCVSIYNRKYRALTNDNGRHVNHAKLAKVRERIERRRRN